LDNETLASGQDRLWPNSKAASFKAKGQEDLTVSC